MQGETVSVELAESVCCVSGCKINSKTHPDTEFHVLIIEDVTLYNLPNYSLKRELKMCNDHYFSNELLNLDHDNFISDSPKIHTPSAGETSSNFDLYLNMHNTPTSKKPDMEAVMPDMPSLDDDIEMPSKAKAEICRVCLLEGKFKNIYTDKINNIPIKDMFERFYFERIPNFPQYICENCLKELSTCYAFFQKLENSTLHLMNMNQSSISSDFKLDNNLNPKNSIDQMEIEKSDVFDLKFEAKKPKIKLDSKNIESIQKSETEISKNDLDIDENSDILLKYDKKKIKNDSCVTKLKKPIIVNSVDIENDMIELSKTDCDTNQNSDFSLKLRSRKTRLKQQKIVVANENDNMSELSKNEWDDNSLKLKKIKTKNNSKDIKKQTKKSSKNKCVNIGNHKKLSVVLEKLTLKDIKNIKRNLKRKSKRTKKQIKPSKIDGKILPETNDNNDLATQLKNQLETILKDLNPSIAKVEINNSIKMKEKPDQVKRGRGRPIKLENLQKNRILTITSYDIKEIFEKAVENQQISPDHLFAPATLGQNKFILESAAYPCHRCSKLFLKKEVLDLHVCSADNKVQLRIKGKSHICQKCSRAFSNLQQMLKHNCFAVTCVICLQEFTTNNKLEIHQEKHHGIKSMKQKFKCEICGKVYSHKNTLTAHIKGKHSSLEV